MKWLKILFIVLLVPVLALSVLADHDDHDEHTHHHHEYHDEDYFPYYGSINYGGYYYQSFTYGWSGWEQNRVYYRYHSPYYTQQRVAPYYYGNPGPSDWYW